MADPSQPSRSGPGSVFWALLGVAILAVGGATAYRIAMSKGPLSITGDKDGKFSITLEQARAELKGAAEGVAKAQADLEVREKAVDTAFAALSDKEQKLNEVADKLQGGRVQVPPQVMTDLRVLRLQNPTAALSTTPKIDPRVLQQVETRLSNADALTKQLAQK